VRVVPITIKESYRYLVQYKKLSMFCFICGLMGHEMTKYGDGVHDVKLSINVSGVIGFR